MRKSRANRWEYIAEVTVMDEQNELWVTEDWWGSLQVPHVVTFLGDYAGMVRFQGVHMVFNNQGHPSGEAFIQMVSEQAALATAQGVHNNFMHVGKKKRYIEVFQCSAEDLNLNHLTNQAPITPQVPLGFLPQAGILPQAAQAHAQQFWSYPSPPISPIVPGQVSQLIIYGIHASVGVPELVANFTTPEQTVENVSPSSQVSPLNDFSQVLFTRWPTHLCPGEAIITIRTRAAAAQTSPLSQLSAPNFPYQPAQNHFLQQPILME